MCSCALVSAFVGLLSMRRGDAHVGYPIFLGD